MYILGISCFYHDAAAVILRDGELIAAAEEERFTRVKHDSGFPNNAVKFCLGMAGISGKDLQYVVFYEKPFLKFERILKTSLQTFPKSWRLFQEAMSVWMTDKLWIKSLIRDKVGCEYSRILFSDHHLSHAASAFYPSPFKEAAIITVDGVGEWATTTIGIGKGNQVRILKEIQFPHSLGLLYSAFTAFLGFQVNDGEYKVMGMAPYGEPKYLDEVNKLIKVNRDSSFSMDMDYFSYQYSDKKTFNEKFVRLFGKQRTPETHFFTEDTGFPIYFGGKPTNYAHLCQENKHYADIAASIQMVTEEILLKLASYAYHETGLKKLCVAGGVGYNSSANGKILTKSDFDEVFIQPAAGDSGGALGAALVVYHGMLGNPRKFVMEHAYWGKGYSDKEVRETLRDNGIDYRYYLDDNILLDRTVGDLLSGKVVGWFQGRFEWGARALGNRSILADPRSDKMKDLVNIKIKFREPFRPFAPVILEESVADYFEFGDKATKQYPSRFMLWVLPYKPNGQKVAAVNHMGTGRLQTIKEEWNPRYYQLVKRFNEATGVPILLNTSFNLRGEPIVNSPQDAINTFRKSGIDVLVMEHFRISK